MSCEAAYADIPPLPANILELANRVRHLKSLKADAHLLREAMEQLKQAKINHACKESSASNDASNH